MALGDPLFILAPHRSYTSVICAMLGQHPQLYGLPEMNLFVREEMWEWWLSFGRGAAIGAHGPLRVVAEIYGGAQTEENVREAWFWLRQRLQWRTGDLLRAIAEEVAPRGIVDKSPTTAYRVEYMERVRQHFPEARFLHLVRHPLGHGKSVLRSFEDFDRYGALPHSLRQVLKGEAAPVRRPAHDGGERDGADGGLFDFSTDPPTLDPQMRWHQLHTSICDFLEGVPRDRWLRIAGEAFMADLDAHLRRIAEWMGIRTDREALEAMRHPENSPYARFGPSNAHLGNDPYFLENPVLDEGRSRSAQTLEGPLPWRKDGTGFREEVKALARYFGYT